MRNSLKLNQRRTVKRPILKEKTWEDDELSIVVFTNKTRQQFLV